MPKKTKIKKKSKYYVKNREAINERRRISYANKVKRIATMMKPSPTSESAARMRKKRCRDAIEKVLPGEDSERASVIASLLHDPATRTALVGMGRVNTIEKEAEACMANAVLVDVAEAVNTVKACRSKDSTTALHVGLSFLCGKSVLQQRIKGAVANRLGINQRRVSSCASYRNTVLTDEKSCWLIFERKTRSDAIPQEHRQKAYDFWGSHEISRQTGNKRDFVNRRIGPKR